MFDRFELVPAVLVLLSIALLVGHHERAAWIVLGLATVLKLYPVVVAPLLALVAWRHRAHRQLLAHAGAFVAAIVVPTVMVTRGDLAAVTAFFKYHIDRGLEIETVYASFWIFPEHYVDLESFMPREIGVLTVRTQ